MCVPGKRERDARWNIRKDVGIMRQQDHRRTILDSVKRRSHIVRACPEIADSSDPHTTRGCLSRHRRFFYDSYPVLLQRPLDAVVIEPAVMVAEDGKDTSGRPECLQFAGNLFGRHEASADDALNDEVAKDADDIGPGCIGPLDNVVQFRGTVERGADVQIGQDSDAHRPAREPRQGDAFFRDDETRRLQPECAEPDCEDRECEGYCRPA